MSSGKQNMFPKHKNMFFNKTHHWPNLFGYCHWFDFKNTVTWEVSSFLQNITGLLEYKNKTN